MAVKLPPDTWISQILTLKGTRDNVYSKIDGSLVGYVKDGKFVQTSQYRIRSLLQVSSR